MYCEENVPGSSAGKVRGLRNIFDASFARSNQQLYLLRERFRVIFVETVARQFVRHTSRRIVGYVRS